MSKGTKVKGVDYTEYPESYGEFNTIDQFWQMVGVWWCFTHTFACMIGIPVILVLGLLFATRITLAILTPYSVWYIYSKDRSLKGRPSKFITRYFRHARWWRGFREFSKAKLVKTSDIDPTRNYILGFHPHGLLGSSLFINIHCNEHFHEAYPGLETFVTTLPSNFTIPFWRDYLVGLGVYSCERKGIVHRLQSGAGKVVAIVIGGGEEFLYMEKNTLDLVLKKRKGFASIALTTGSGLIPVIGFGENDLFELIKSDYLEPLHKLTQLLFRCQFPLIKGGKLFGLLPHQQRLITVVGKPILVDKVKDPSQKQIDELHQRYIDELQKLYDDFKDIYDKDRKRDLTLVA